MPNKPIRDKDNFLVFGSPRIGDDEINEVVATMRSGWLGTGPKVARFEKDFSHYKQSPHTAAVNSCTAALHLSMLAIKLKPGDEVITTALTFCATVNAIIHTGATPVVVDVDPISMNIDPAKIIDKINSKTKAIIPVHFAGRCCDMDAIQQISNQYGIDIIEDCAHAIESTYKGKTSGSFGRFSCFSFYVTKNIVTGEGGMVIARDKKDIEQIRILALHGMSKHAWSRFSDDGYKHYQVVECGYKYNMMDLQAAIGIHQLKKIDHYWEKRQSVWQRYNKALKNLPIGLPAKEESNSRHAYHLYTILIDKEKCGISRDAFLSAMTAHNIGVGVHYLSIPEHPYYQETFNWRPEDYPESMRIGQQTVSLPLSANLSDKDVDDVILAVKSVLGGE